MGGEQIAEQPYPWGKMLHSTTTSRLHASQLVEAARQASLRDTELCSSGNDEPLSDRTVARVRLHGLQPQESDFTEWLGEQTARELEARCIGHIKESDAAQEARMAEMSRDMRKLLERSVGMLLQMMENDRLESRSNSALLQRDRAGQEMQD